MTTGGSGYIQYRTSTFCHSLLSFRSTQRPLTYSRRAALEGRWATAMRFFCGPRLLVIDEFAYTRHSPDPEANTALFE